LIDTGGRDTTALTNRVRALVGTSAKVTDVADTRGAVGSSLTSVNLTGLTRIELGFGLCLTAATGALVPALRVVERRRTFAIANALGATRNQRRSFVLSEAFVPLVCGLAGGAVMGGVLSQVLVKALTGVFDPPPASLTVPSSYLVATATATITSIGAVSLATARSMSRSPAASLREL
jgi:putative ABC transport system permease protein